MSVSVIMTSDPPRHDQDGPAHNWGATERPLLRASRLARLSTNWATSTVGTSSSTRSSRAVTNLFGRLEVRGAPRWADSAVGERRWSERGVSGCAASGPTHFSTPCSLEHVAEHICACSLRADVTAFVNRVVPRVWSGAIASVLGRGCARPCKLSNSIGG